CFALWTSVTAKIRPALRSGLASIGRDRSRPAACVVSMHTPTFSMMSQTRSLLSCLLMSMDLSFLRQRAAPRAPFAAAPAGLRRPHLGTNCARPAFQQRQIFELVYV